MAENTITITLTMGKEAIIDAEDYEAASQYRWVLLRTGRHQELCYATTKIDGRTAYLHRFVMNAAQGESIDHINDNGLDCRKANLRRCTHQQNIANQRVQARSVSGHRGVQWDKARGLWRARIKVNGKETFLGRFARKEDAERAYDDAARDAFGEFTRI